MVLECEPRRHVHTPNPWRCERLRESAANGRRTSGVLCFHLFTTKIKKSDSSPSEKTVTKRSCLDPATKAKKQEHLYVRTHIYGYFLPSGHPHTYVCLSCSIGCLTANFPTKVFNLAPRPFFKKHLGILDCPMCESQQTHLFSFIAVPEKVESLCHSQASHS